MEAQKCGQYDVPYLKARTKVSKRGEQVYLWTFGTQGRAFAGGQQSFPRALHGRTGGIGGYFHAACRRSPAKGGVSGALGGSSALSSAC